MPSPDDRPLFKWKEKMIPGPTEKKVWRLFVCNSHARYAATYLSAEWFPQLNMWRAVERVEGAQKFGGHSVFRPHYRAEFPCEPEMRDFHLALCMAFLEAYYVLTNK